MLELKVVLSKLVRNYRLLPPPQCFSLDLAVEVVLKSRSGVMLRVERRHRKMPGRQQTQPVPSGMGSRSTA